MDAVFERILQISISGSVIVLAVLVLRLILRRAPKRAVCLLWMLAVLRLLLPLRIESDWSLQPEPVEFAPPAQVEHFDSVADPKPVPPEFLEDAVEYPIQSIPEPEKESSPMEVLGWVWLAGMAVLAFHGTTSYLRLRRRVRDSVILEEGIWICPGLDTAFVLGFFRPQVYLPVLTPQERELVLLHERQHIRRGDHWWKLAAFAAVTVHWFNPLAWVTYALMCRDMELACDQETVKGMDNAKRKAYSAALLSCAAKGHGIAACPVAFGEISVKERIKMVLNYKKPGFWVTVLALIAAIAVGFFLLTSPKELTDLDRCEQALMEWQGMDHIHLRSSYIHVGDYALNSTAEADYWASGGNALERVETEEDSRNCLWFALWDGKLYNRVDWVYNAESGSTSWEEDMVREKWSLPWILALNWDAWQITHVKTEPTERGEDIYLEVYRPGEEVCQLTFCFASDELAQIQRTYEQVVPDELDDRDGLMASISTEIHWVEETDRVEIGKKMAEYGPTPELVWLYSEMEALQNSSSIHFVVDMEIDSNYDGWDTCRQEYLKSENIWYRNFDYQTSSGDLTTSYLCYGGKVYAQEVSENTALADRPWSEIEDRGFGQFLLLTRDWTKLEVLNVEKERNGSAVITLQGDLTSTEDTTYFEKTYEFHLNPDGKLTGMVSKCHASKYISERGAQGTFEIRSKDTLSFLDTPQEEIEARVLEVWGACKEQCFADSSSTASHHSEGAGHHHHGW